MQFYLNQGFVVFINADLFNVRYSVHAFGYSTEYGVFAIEPGTGHRRNKEL
jgi:hypothetical protein